MPRFLLVPLDNRPCNLLFVRQIARIGGAEIQVPPEHWLGSYLNPGLSDRLTDWVLQTARRGDTLLLSSDMLGFGGLVGSRTALQKLPAVLDRLHRLRELRSRGVRIEVLAIVPRLALRTSEGEAPFEQQLSSWAASLDATPPAGTTPSGVPAVWADEYVGVRQRNRQVLLDLLNEVQQGWLDKLVIGQDDSAARGLHTLDQAAVRNRIAELGLTDRVTLLSGADELSMDMVAGRLANLYGIHPALELEYSEAGSERKIPPLESHPLQEMVEQHVALCGASTAAPDQGEVKVFVQVPADKPFAIPDASQQATSSAFVERVRESLVRGRRTALADLALINRMDPFLAQAVIDRVPLTRLEAIAAWNTPANAFGTVAAQTVVRRLADARARRWPISRVLESARTHVAFSLARLIDDYGYQTLVRSEFYPQARHLPTDPDPLNSPLLPLGRDVRLRLIGWARDLYDRHFAAATVELPGARGPARLGPLELEVVLPWPRLFEVEVRLSVLLQPVESGPPRAGPSIDPNAEADRF